MKARGRYSGFTANLNVDYRVPMPASSIVVFIIWIERIEGRKMFLKGEARRIDEDSERDDEKEGDCVDDGGGGRENVGDKWLGKNRVKFSEAQALYIVPRESYEKVASKGEQL